MGGDEDKAAWLQGPVLVSDTDETPAADHVVDLVLFVRPLAVARARRPHRETHAQLLRGEEVDVPVALLVAWLRIELRNLVRLHRHHYPAVEYITGGGHGGDQSSRGGVGRGPRARS